MSDLGFILTPREEAVIVQSAVNRGGWFVPDIEYETPSPIRLNSVIEYLRFREKTRLFFICHPSYSRVPLDVRRTKKDSKVVYFVMQGNGGPTIDFLSAVQFLEDSDLKINPGFLGHRKTFWNSSTNQNESMPSELLLFYAGLSKVAKDLGTRRKIGVRTYWVGKEAQALLDTRQMQLGIVGTSTRRADG